MMNEAFLLEIRQLYQEAEKRLSDLLTFGNLSKAGARRRTAILAQVHDELRKLGGTTAAGYKSTLPEEYLAGAARAKSVTGWGSNLTTSTFSGIDTAAVETALSTALSDTDFALNQVARRAKELVDSKYLDVAKNAGISKIVARMEAAGEGVAAMSQELAGYISPDWLDKYAAAQDGQYFKLAGRTWRMSDYAHLTAQTHLGTTQNLGMLNWSQAHGFRFAQMSQHPGACKTCSKYQGKVYSTTGKAERDHTGVTRQPISTVPGGGGLVHPYCRHSFSPWGIPDPDTAMEFGSPKTAAAATRHPAPVEPDAGRAGGVSPTQATKIASSAK